MNNLQPEKPRKLLFALTMALFALISTRQAAAQVTVLYCLPHRA